jgi:hypothetical protein
MTTHLDLSLQVKSQLCDQGLKHGATRFLSWVQKRVWSVTAKTNSLCCVNKEDANSPTM